MKSNKGVKNMEFRVGDKVRIRDDLIVGKKYGSITCLPNMKGHCTVMEFDRSDRVYLVMIDGESVTFYMHESMLEPAYKFKVGDMVIGNHPSRYAITKKGWVGRVVSIKNKINFRVKSIETGVEYSVDPKYFDLYTEPALKKIVITTDGETTLARLYEGKRVVKSAEAKCSPADEFDFTTGAELAFNRLLGKKPETKPEEKKLYNGKVVCVDNGGFGFYTAGKIYEFKDGKTIDDEGDSPFYSAIKSFAELEKRSHAKWLEIKE